MTEVSVGEVHGLLLVSFSSALLLLTTSSVSIQSFSANGSNLPVVGFDVVGEVMFGGEFHITFCA